MPPYPCNWQIAFEAFKFIEINVISTILFQLGQFNLALQLWTRRRDGPTMRSTGRPQDDSGAKETSKPPLPRTSHSAGGVGYADDIFIWISGPSSETVKPILESKAKAVVA